MGPLAFFAGIWTAGWTGVRKIKTGLETTDLYAVLTTDLNAEVGAIHPKAMPVLLTRPEEVEIWMTAPWEQKGAPATDARRLIAGGSARRKER